MEIKQLIGYNAITRGSNLTITYAYDVLDELGNKTKSNVQESFIAMITTDEGKKIIDANNVIVDTINKRLNPVVQTILGSVTINYKDDKGNQLENPTILNNLALSSYYFSAKIFTGYNLTGNAMQSVNLTTDNQNQVITFIYTPIIKGSIIVKYIDKNSIEIATQDNYTGLDLGNYTYQSKVIQGYTLTNDSSQTITLTANDYNKVVTFIYKKDNATISTTK